MFVFSIYDKKACVHTSPFFAINKDTAIRSFCRLVNDPRSDANMFPDDYALYCIGEFHDYDGNIVPVLPVEHIVDAFALLKVVKDKESN